MPQTTIPVSSAIWASSSSKNRISLAQRLSLNRLESVRNQREPFRQLSRSLITETLAQYLPTAGRVVEIGMGDGQLYDRLPEIVRPRVLHTDPQAAITRAFRKEHPDVFVLPVPAEHLPLKAGGATAALALCVMDVVPQPLAVVRELARVLPPGGVFIHWLDMSTLLSPIVATLVDTDLLLLPNVFGDPAESEWPEDLFALPRPQLALVAKILGEHGHTMARPLAQYLSLFLASPFPIATIGAELASMQSDPAVRSALKGAFQAALDLAHPVERQQLRSFQGCPISSSRHFERRLCDWFSPEQGFRIEESSLKRRWQLVPRHGSPFAYMSCHIGEQRTLPQIPETLLCPDAAGAEMTVNHQEQMLLELGIFSFVARRL